ncbi:hypothetical protein ABKW28_03280 [Nocardioides sp. 31GB23]|uniref:DUF4240 domain-containing protein n=1 Tax=Nocardioides salarius TaxID=374513 RepID=A0ABS2MF94_9ACTN|nr:hypothetical protein [Nocardioides salarius]MBM7509857.1 hypothetical protein [Nocardioides salarius]
MTPDRFWRLVELLAGTADEETVPRLEAALAPGEHETFADAVQDHVDRLLARREVPGSHAGDTAEHLAAAVVAAGRDTYERELALDTPLDPGRWRWEEAERLLVAGLVAEEEPHDGVGDLAEQLGVHLQWRSVQVPDGVLTSWGEEVAEIDGVLGDDPAFGRVPADDPHWHEALQRLAEDPEFHHRRAAVAGLELHVVVRDTDEATLSAFPDADAAEHVVLVVPVEAMTADPHRAEAYVEAVVTMLVSLTED